MNGQMTLDMFITMPAGEPEPERLEEPTVKIDFSCFSAKRGENGENSIELGKCPFGSNMKERGFGCNNCDAHIAFYKKTNEYHNKGEGWGIALALAREYFKISTVPEWSVEAYRKKGGKK